MKVSRFRTINVRQSLIHCFSHCPLDLLHGHLIGRAKVPVDVDLVPELTDDPQTFPRRQSIAMISFPRESNSFCASQMVAAGSGDVPNPNHTTASALV